MESGVSFAISFWRRVVDVPITRDRLLSYRIGMRSGDLPLTGLDTRGINQCGV